MSELDVPREISGIAVTVARYGLAERMARNVHNDEPIFTDLAGFIVADIADGAILRRFNMDTPLRRVTDGIVDHASVARVAYEVWQKYPSARRYIGLLALRAAVVGGLNAVHLATTGEVTKGRSKQKATNLASAAFSLAVASGNHKVTHIAGIMASGIAVTTAFSHLKDLGKKHVSGIREL